MSANKTCNNLQICLYFVKKPHLSPYTLLWMVHLLRWNTVGLKQTLKFFPLDPLPPLSLVFRVSCPVSPTQSSSRQVFIPSPCLNLPHFLHNISEAQISSNRFSILHGSILHVKTIFSCFPPIWSKLKGSFSQSLSLLLQPFTNSAIFNLSASQIQTVLEDRNRETLSIGPASYQINTYFM